MTFLIVLLIPVVIAGSSFFLLPGTVTWKEFLLQVVLGVVVCAVGWQVARWGALRGTEHLNGRVTAKIADTQSCCHCTTVCDSYDKNNNCTSSHDSCSHSIDYYWDLQTSVGKVPIESCSGWNNPPDVWVNASVGDPAVVDHGYTNYLLADENSLLIHPEVAKYVDMVPEYPNVFSKYKVNHVVGDLASSASLLQHSMREINADLGAPNQVDITLLLTGIQDPAYAQAVEAKWLYGPKNSITIVAGLRNRTVSWVRVVTFSKVEMLKVRLRDHLQGLSIDDPKFMNTIRQEIGSGFKRTAMADFEYLASTASPHNWSLALLILGEILISLGLAFWAHVKDIFGDERRNIYSKYY